MNKTRKFFAVAIAFTALTVGVFATVSDANATYYCNWTPRGTVCAR